MRRAARNRLSSVADGDGVLADYNASVNLFASSFVTRSDGKYSKFFIVASYACPWRTRGLFRPLREGGWQLGARQSRSGCTPRNDPSPKRCDNALHKGR